MPKPPKAPGWVPAQSVVEAVDRARARMMGAVSLEVVSEDVFERVALMYEGRDDVPEYRVMKTGLTPRVFRRIGSKWLSAYVHDGAEVQRIVEWMEATARDAESVREGPRGMSELYGWDSRHVPLNGRVLLGRTVATLADWAQALGVPEHMVRSRLSNGDMVLQALRSTRERRRDVRVRYEHDAGVQEFVRAHPSALSVTISAPSSGSAPRASLRYSGRHSQSWRAAWGQSGQRF